MTAPLTPDEVLETLRQWPGSPATRVRARLEIAGRHCSLEEVERVLDLLADRGDVDLRWTVTARSVWRTQQTRLRYALYSAVATRRSARP